jgi:hypothetical protein
MSTQKRKNLEKLIFDTLDKEIEGTDIYNNDGSMWLIFTDEKRWAIEFTKERTLWYNYYIFNNVLMLFGMDNNETAEYVKKWFENRFLFKPKVENTIQNGVKSTASPRHHQVASVENTIQNGVKFTHGNEDMEVASVENTIQNGVKDPKASHFCSITRVENTIQNGVKTMMSGSEWYHQDEVEDIIQKGVKS